MTAVIVLGAQWGDEGKGKIVDHLAESSDVVVRYAGGPNAGHTLVVGGQRIVVRLVPSGILRPQARCVMGQGMVIDARLLVQELDELEVLGHKAAGRLFVSERAHIILPHHVLADEIREVAADPAHAIGTTRRGIGPAYEDKIARRGMMAGCLRDLDASAGLVTRALEAWAPFFAAAGKPLPVASDVIAGLRPLAKRLVPYLADTSLLLDADIRAGKSVMFEGAQGTLLDIDHGTYPFVTSSSAVAGGACTGAGVGPRVISRVVGVTKAYSTRVGGGPFPTELSDAAGEHMRQVGAEFGSVTGRPRRTGWLDLPALRYSRRVNGLDALILTKLDVLTGLDKVRVCVAYETPQGHTPELPIDQLGTPGASRPVYQELEGWSEPLGQVRSFQELPPAAQAYVRFIENAVQVPCDMLSVGPAREATICLRHPFAC